MKSRSNLSKQSQIRGAANNTPNNPQGDVVDSRVETGSQNKLQSAADQSSQVAQLSTKDKTSTPAQKPPSSSQSGSGNTSTPASQPGQGSGNTSAPASQPGQGPGTTSAPRSLPGQGLASAVPPVSQPGAKWIGLFGKQPSQHAMGSFAGMLDKKADSQASALGPSIEAKPASKEGPKKREYDKEKEPGLATSSGNHYKDGWGPLYGITNDKELREFFWSNQPDLSPGQHDMDLGQHKTSKEGKLASCNLVYIVNSDQSITVTHCGPSGRAG